MHPEARAFVEQALRGAGPWSRVVEVGGRNINGGIRDLVTADEYICVDLEPGPDVDVVADCREWSPPGPADLVLCLEVLEHAPDPAGVVFAATGYLRSGGRFVLTCAGPGRAPHSGHDGMHVRSDEHYANIDPADLVAWLKAAGIDDGWVEYAPASCDVYATGTWSCG